MASSNLHTPKITPPSLASLMSQFLATRSHDAASEQPLPSDLMEPHDAPSGFRADTSTTWSDALLAVNLACETAALPDQLSDWASTCRIIKPRYAIAMCVGNFPQLLGDLAGLLQNRDLSSLMSPAVKVQANENTLRVSERFRSMHPELADLFTAAGHRLLGNYEAAESILVQVESRFTGHWRAIWTNERAALLWEQGQYAEALAIWNKLADGPIKAFNSGVAELCSGRPQHALRNLNTASKLLPNTSGWSHLARIYSVLAEASIPTVV